jgi:hypothetical protein
MIRKIVRLSLIAFAFGLVFVAGDIIVESLHQRLELPYYGWIKAGLYLYLLAVIGVFTWRLYDGFYRTCDFLLDD